MAAITQYPVYPNVWVHNNGEGKDRIFTDYVIRPENSEPWIECTDEYRKEWESLYPSEQVEE